jgi:hypothetical protein
MASSSFGSKIVLLLLLCVLTLPWMLNAEPRGRAGQQPPVVSSGLLGQLWSTLLTIWGEEGCRIDPFGRCADQGTPEEPADRVDEGCMIDPYGGGCRDNR